MKRFGRIATWIAACLMVATFELCFSFDVASSVAEQAVGDKQACAGNVMNSSRNDTLGDAVKVDVFEGSFRLFRTVTSKFFYQKRTVVLQKTTWMIFPFQVATLRSVNHYFRLPHNEAHPNDYYVFALRHILC